MTPVPSSQVPQPVSGIPGPRKAGLARPEPRPERRHGHEGPRIPHAVTFSEDHKSCSQLLSDLMQLVPKEGMSVRTLIHSLGQRGLLMACMVFCLPSMVPIPIPGISIPQGFIIGLIGIGLLLNRAPMLPERLLEFRLSHPSLFMILDKGTRLFARIERLSHPRLDALTSGLVMRAVNGVLLVAGAALLMAPFPIPFSNILPAYGILFLAFGIMQRDGWLILASYLMMVLSALYIAVVLHFGFAWLQALFG